MTPPTTELSIRADRRAAAIVAGARAWPVTLLLGAAAVLAPSPVALICVALAALVAHRLRRVLRAALGAFLHDDPLVTVRGGRVTVGGERIALAAIAAAEPRTERIAERDVATGVRLRLREGGTRTVDLRSALEGPEDAVARVLQAVAGSAL